MSVYERDGSPYWWMHVESAPKGKQKTSTKVRIGVTPAERKVSRDAADRLYHRASIRATVPEIAAAPAPTVPLSRTLDRWCFVYFIRAGDEVKIGRALDPPRRLKSLQTGHADPLTLLAAVPAHVDLEPAIHARFRHLHTRGEWFRLAPDLVAFIHHIQQGANPIALLWEATS